MGRFLHRRTHTVGLPPGTVVHVGLPAVEHSEVRAVVYQPDRVDESRPTGDTQLSELRSEKGVIWIDVTGVHDPQVIEQVGRAFDMHPLALEDVATTDQRPKIEEYDGQLFIVARMLSYDTDSREMSAEQLSIVLGDNFVISFHERPGNMVDSVLERIRKGRGRIRRMGADYLAYALLDTVVDHYFVVLDELGEVMEDLEDQLLETQSDEPPRELHRLKRELLFMRKSVWPLREVCYRLQRGEPPLHEEVGLYFRDLSDHTVQVIDTVETYRDVTSGLMDLYLSTLSNRTNAVMKVLTIIATLFMPATLLVGIYGMNFKDMPELQWRWGYPTVWGVIVISMVGMIVWFRRRRWL